MTGEELRALRKGLGWTQKRIGELLGVTTTTVARWERGERKISRLAEMSLGRLLNAKQKD